MPRSPGLRRPDRGRPRRAGRRRRPRACCRSSAASDRPVGVPSRSAAQCGRAAGDGAARTGAGQPAHQQRGQQRHRHRRPARPARRRPRPAPAARRPRPRSASSSRTVERAPLHRGQRRPAPAGRRQRSSDSRRRSRSSSRRCSSAVSRRPCGRSASMPAGVPGYGHERARTAEESRGIMMRDGGPGRAGRQRLRRRARALGRAVGPAIGLGLPRLLRHPVWASAQPMPAAGSAWSWCPGSPAWTRAWRCCGAWFGRLGYRPIGAGLRMNIGLHGRAGGPAGAAGRGSTPAATGGPVVLLGHSRGGWLAGWSRCAGPSWCAAW